MTEPSRRMRVVADQQNHSQRTIEMKGMNILEHKLQLHSYLIPSSFRTIPRSKHQRQSSHLCNKPNDQRHPISISASLIFPSVHVRAGLAFISAIALAFLSFTTAMMPTAPMMTCNGIITTVKYRLASACMQILPKCGSGSISTSAQRQDQLWIVAT